MTTGSFWNVVLLKDVQIIERNISEEVLKRIKETGDSRILKKNTRDYEYNIWFTSR